MAHLRCLQFVIDDYPVHHQANNGLKCLEHLLSGDRNCLEFGNHPKEDRFAETFDGNRIVEISLIVLHDKRNALGIQPVLSKVLMKIFH